MDGFGVEVDLLLFGCRTGGLQPFLGLKLTSGRTTEGRGGHMVVGGVVQRPPISRLTSRLKSQGTLRRYGVPDTGEGTCECALSTFQVGEGLLCRRLPGPWE